MPSGGTLVAANRIENAPLLIDPVFQKVGKIYGAIVPGTGFSAFMKDRSLLKQFEKKGIRFQKEKITVVQVHPLNAACTGSGKLGEIIPE